VWWTKAKPLALVLAADGFALYLSDLAGVEIEPPGMQDSAPACYLSFLE